jgi:hypothetical protein
MPERLGYSGNAYFIRFECGLVPIKTRHTLHGVTGFVFPFVKWRPKTPTGKKKVLCA